MSANNTFIKNSITGETYENLFTNLTVPGILKLTNVVPKTIETEVLHIEPLTGVVVRGAVAPPSTSESGLSYVNTTATVILNIPTTPTIIPIFYAVSPTITQTLNWKSADWNLGTGTQNRFIYTGTSKKFHMEVDLAISTGASSGTIYVALYKNGSALANSGVGQTQQVFGALVPTIETMSFTFPFTAVSGDFFELYIYGSSTGLNIQPVSASSFSPSTLCPSIAIEINQVNI
jgi:hypothetical protein